MSFKTIEEVQLFSSSLKIMKFWSFLLVHNWRRYVCLLPYFLINTSQFLDIYNSSESVDAIIRNAYITVLFFNTILRAVMLCINRFKYEEFMEECKVFYEDIMHTKDVQIRQMWKETTIGSQTIAKINLIMGTCSCVGFVTYPIFATSRVLPFGMFIPGVDKYSTPYYEIFFILQVIITPMGCCMYIPFTNLIVAFIMFGILMCKVLQHRLRNLKTVNPEKLKDDVIWCIRYQLQIVRYVKAINHLTTYINLVEFLAFGAMLCAMLFLLIIVQTVAQMVIVTAYIIMIFAQSVVMYYYGNELYVESIAIAAAAYDSNWFTFDVETQKMMKLLILRAQKPCAIFVGGVYPMNLQMLQSLLNATYTYFTLLRRVYG